MAMNMDAALRIKAKVDGVNNIVALNRNIAAIEGTAKGATGAMRGLTGAAAGLSGALGALAPLASIAGLVGLAKGSLDAGDKMFDLAQKTGVSVEALARFNKAARVSGTDIDAVGKALVKLSKGMVEAAATGKGKAADSLKALGISAVDASGKLKSADRVTLEIANRFKSMADGPAKAALAVNLFGKAGADMIPLLNMGGDAIDKLSVKMTTAFAEKADQYSDKLAMLSGKVGAFGADLLIALLPALNAVTDAVSAAVSGFNAMPAPMKNMAVSGALIAVAFGPLTGLVKGASVAFIACQAALQGFQLQMRLAAMQGIPMLNAAIMSIPGIGWTVATIAGLALLSKAVYDTNETFRNFVNNIGGVIASDFRNAVNSMAGDARSATGDIQKAYDGLVRTLQASGDFIKEMFKGAFGSVAESGQSSAGQLAGIFGNAFNTIVSQGAAAFSGLSSLIANWWSGLPAPIRALLGSNGISALTGAAGYVGSAASRASTPNAQATGMYGKYGAPDSQVPFAKKTPSGSAAGFTPDIAALAGSAGSGAGGAAKAASFKLSSKGQALVAAAQKLGVSPLDLATIIGFETAGSYSPSKRGGAGGNYMGLIQFGRQERKDYGANPGQSFEEQVQGPVVRYFQDRFKGVGRSTQGAGLLDLYRTVLGGNPNANINGKDSFGTSPASGVARMGPHRQESLKRFFGGSMANVGYGADAAGADAAQGFEAAQKEAEQTAKQLTAARDLLAVRQAAFAVTSAASPLEKLSAEFDQQRADRMRDYAGKLRDARSDEERILIAQSQTVDIRGSEIAFQEQRKTLIADQLKLEQEKAKVVTELATRDSIGAGVRQGLDGYVEQVGTLRDAVGQLTTNSIGGLEDSLVSLATTGKANFQEFAASVLKDVTRMIIRQLILKAIMQAIGAIGGGGGGGLGFGGAGDPLGAGGAFWNAKGNAFAANGIIPFASGGIVNRPTLFKFASGGAIKTGVLGEAGPEAIMPLKRGADGKLGVAGGGAGTTVNVSVDAKGTSVQGNSGQGEQLGRVIAQAVQMELVKQKRPGGILAAA